MAVPTDQELLDAARSCLLKRLRGDAYEEYTTAEMQFKGTKLTELRALIRDLEQSVAAESNGGGFRLVEGWE